MSGVSFDSLRKNGDGFVNKVGLASIVEEDVFLNALITAGATVAVNSRVGTEILSGSGFLQGASSLFLAAQVSGANYAEGDVLTIKLMRDRGVQIGASITVTVPSVNAGFVQLAEIADPNGYINGATYYEISGTITAVAGATLKLTLLKIGGSSSVNKSVAVSGDTYTETSDGVTILGAVVDASGDEPLTAGTVSALAMDAYRKLLTAAFDTISGSDKVSRVDPDALVKKPLKLLVNATDDGVGSVRTIINSKGYDNATIGVICAGGITVDLFGTNNDAADDTADTGWVSLSSSSVVDTTGGWVLSGQEAWDRLMIKRVASDATNSTVVDVNLGG